MQYFHPKHFLSQLNIKPNKLLGQSFLHDGRVLEKIMRAANLSENDTVLEIGPGLGFLTQALAYKASRVIAVEKDPGLAAILRRQFAETPNVEIVQGDILNANLPLPKEYSVVANIPYYITSPVMRLFLEEAKHRPKLLVLMVQKEVAQRICAKPPDMSLLAVSVQFYAKPSIVSFVSKACFWPMPKVDSAILRITPVPLSTNIDPVQFFAIARAGFKQPRKQLCNNLAAGLKKTKQEIQSWLARSGVPYTTRPETLSVQDWVRMCKT